MNIRLKSGNIVGASLYTSNQSIQHAALPPIKATLYWHAYAGLLPINRIQIAMKYCIKAENHAFACIMAPMDVFYSACFVDITTDIAGTSYFSCWDSFGTSCCYSVGIVDISYCIMAISCIPTILRTILFNR